MLECPPSLTFLLSVLPVSRCLSGIIWCMPLVCRRGRGRSYFSPHWVTATNKEICDKWPRNDLEMTSLSLLNYPFISTIRWSGEVGTWNKTRQWEVRSAFFWSIRVFRNTPFYKSKFLNTKAQTLNFAKLHNVWNQQLVKVICPR